MSNIAGACCWWRCGGGGGSTAAAGALCLQPAACMPSNYTPATTRTRAESSGKTTLALHALAEVQKAGGAVALIDAEHAFDPVFAKVCTDWGWRGYACMCRGGGVKLTESDQQCPLTLTHTTTTATATTSLQHLGVDVDKLLLCQPDSGEMALEVADTLIRCGVGVCVGGWAWGGWEGTGGGHRGGSRGRAARQLPYLHPTTPTHPLLQVLCCRDGGG